MEIINNFRRGSVIWGALEHLRNYKTLSIRELNEAPFRSNGSNKVIQTIKEYLEENPQFNIALSFVWKKNPNTKRPYKEFFLREV